MMSAGATARLISEDALDSELLARAGSVLLPGVVAQRPLRVAMSSLALGGAERIVAEWLSDEAASGRPCFLAVARDQRAETTLHPRARLIRRPAAMPVLDFWASVGAHWAALDPEPPVSAHLLALTELQALAAQGLRLIPTLHNDPEGWKGSPELWDPRAVACALGCAPFVERAGREANPGMHWASIRHRPRAPAAAFSPELRARARAAWGVGEDVLLVAMLGSLKAQKDYPKAVEVAARLARMRPAKVLVLGAEGPGPSALPAIVEALGRTGASGAFHWLGPARDVAPLLAAADAFLSTSRHEGFPMAVMEALGCGLPVVAPRLPGLEGLGPLPGLALLDPDSSPEDCARALAALPVGPGRDAAREAAAASPGAARRFWSIPMGIRAAPPGGPGPILFLTANLNAGGAQRSLCNLLVHARSSKPVSPLGSAHLLVCDARPTNSERACELARAGVPVSAIGTGDPARAAEEALARATGSGSPALVFWNLDAKLKTMLAKFAPPGLAIVDVSPGDYAFEEFEAAAGAARLLDMDAQAYSERLSAWVSKRPCEPAWLAAPAVFVPNGCPRPRFVCPGAPEGPPRFVVSGRLAPSKRLELILDAFAMLRSGCPGAELVFYGQAEPREEAYARALFARGAPGVFWEGACPGLDFYAGRWTAQVTLGTRQGSPNAVLESLAAGLPVLANDDGGTAYALGAPEPAGILLPEHPTPEELAAAMRSALAPEARALWVERAGACAAGRHSMDAMARAYAEVLGRAVSGRRAV